MGGGGNPDLLAKVAAIIIVVAVPLRLQTEKNVFIKQRRDVISRSLSTTTTKNRRPFKGGN